MSRTDERYIKPCSRAFYCLLKTNLINFQGEIFVSKYKNAKNEKSDIFALDFNFNLHL